MTQMIQVHLMPGLVPVMSEGQRGEVLYQNHLVHLHQEKLIQASHSERE
jgi:hypothetical protein